MSGAPSMFQVRIRVQFVMKKHASRRLHYDFRFEDRGRLISYVIPDGPSVDPNISRDAIHVADHDPRYIYSERLIPEGEYGAGPTMVWDMGILLANDDPVEALRAGYFEFELRGERMRGRWALIRTHGRWKLKKLSDRFGLPGRPNALMVDSDVSVLSGLTMDEIRAGKSPKISRDDQMGLLN